MDREELSEELRQRLHDAADIGFERCTHGRDGRWIEDGVEDILDALMPRVETLLPQWTRVTAETPLPSNDPAGVALYPNGGRWAAEFVDSLTPGGRNHSQWYCRLPCAPPPPDQPKEVTDAAHA
jgi:hypothetical protein